MQPSPSFNMISQRAGTVQTTLDNAARLRRALDNAIYTLEDIKRRASRGATSDIAEWYCEEIRAMAASALEQLDNAHDVAPQAAE